jgi:hypothetical protein
VQYRVLVGKPVDKGPLERRRHVWDDNIKMDLKLGGNAWTIFDEDRDKWWAFVNTLMNLWVQ